MFKFNKTQELGTHGQALGEAEAASMSGLDTLKEWSGGAALTAVITTAVVAAAEKLMGKKIKIVVTFE